MGLPRRIVRGQLSELRYDSSIVQMFHYLTDFQLSTQLCCPWLANGLPLLPLSTARFTLFCYRECECEIRRQDKLQRRNTNKNSKMLSSIKEQCNREREILSEGEAERIAAAAASHLRTLLVQSEIGHRQRQWGRQRRC